MPKKVAKSRFVGRAREREQLDAALSSARAELIALYGRRRVGKTFLVREHLQPRADTFIEVTGTKGGPAALQRRRFREALERGLELSLPLPDFASWPDALAYLVERVEARVAARPGKPVVVFFDELPWLATPRSRLVESIDYHWNTRLSRLPELTLVLCGSAASWMLRRIVHARGGLHNRLTRQLRLEPFTLRETQELLRARRIRATPHELLSLYMTLGGVPHYLTLVERGESVAETVGRLCFERGGALAQELEQLFASLFDGHDEHLHLLDTLASRTSGLTRNELIERGKLSSGGGLNRRLSELEEAGFVARISPYGARVKNTVFRVIDEHALFQLRWVRPAPKGVLARGGAAYWRARAQTPSYRAWAGYAFESVCLKHALELQRALGIEGRVVGMGAWRLVGKPGQGARGGAQIDLLFDRNDGLINLCEMKFSTEPFTVTKAYARDLKQKLELFETHTRTKKRLVLTLVAPAGLRANTWSEDLIDRALDVNALLA